MKILIIGPPRSGTSSFIRELCDITKYEGIGEPYNYSRSVKNYYDYPIKLKDNTVCKTLTLQTPVEFKNDFLKFIQEFNKYFDKTILLTRLNKEDHILSLLNLKVRFLKNQNQHNHWYKEDIKDYRHLVNYETDVLPHINAVNRTASLLNLTPIPYEELYGDDREKSLKIIESFNLNLDSKELNERLDPKYRYRILKPKPII